MREQTWLDRHPEYRHWQQQPQERVPYEVRAFGLPEDERCAAPRQAVSLRELTQWHMAREESHERVD